MPPVAKMRKLFPTKSLWADGYINLSHCPNDVLQIVLAESGVHHHAGMAAQDVDRPQAALAARFFSMGRSGEHLLIASSLCTA